MTDTAPSPAPGDDAPTEAQRVAGPPNGLLQAWRAPLTAYAVTLGASLVLAVLTIIALSSGAEGEVGDVSEAVEGVFAFVALPFQLTAMALAGRIGLGDGDLSVSLLGLPLLLTATYVLVTLRTASGSERRAPSTTRSERALTSGAAALVAVLVVSILTRVFALRSDGESIHALSISLVLGTLALTFGADFLGREAVSTSVPDPVRSWLPAVTVWLFHVALWLAVALPVLFVLTWVQEGFRPALSLPLWWPTGGLWTYALGHLSSIGAIGFHTYAWSGGGVLAPLGLVVGALVAALAASVLWHLRSARSPAELAQPSSWFRLPAAFAAGGLLITLLSAISVGGTLFGASGSVTVAPAAWTFILLGMWGGAVEALSRTIAPRLAPALPEAVAARARGSATVAHDATPAPEPSTPEQARKVRRIAIIGGAVVAVVVGSVVAVSVVNASLYSPEKVAQKYLDAVADGDVTTALEIAPLSDVETTLLTDEIYGAAADRPTSYSLGESTTFGGAMFVEVEAEGGVGGDGNLTLEEGDKLFGLFDQWEVTSGLTSSLSMPVSSVESVSVNGVEVEVTDGYADYAVLPGTYSVETFAGSEWFEAEPSTVEVGLGEYALVEQTEAEPSAALEQQVDEALDEWLATCMDSTEAEPADCPQSIYAYGDVRNLSWELTTPPTVDFSFFDPSFPMSLYTSDGVATATYEVDESYGYGPKDWVEEIEESSLYFDITVDESGDTLTVDFES